MEFMYIDVADGKPPIHVCVGELIDVLRLRAYLKEANEALDEKEEREDKDV